MRKVATKLFGPNENGEFHEYFEGYCDSSETKPTDLVADGSNVIETDTGDWYFFNEKEQEWVLQISLQE